MRQQVGNAIPAPGYSVSGFTADEEILWSTNDYNQKGVTLAPGQGLLRLGTLLKRNETTKLYEKATSAASAEGILRASVDTGTDDSEDAQKYQANILFAGFLKLDKLKRANSGVTFNNTVLGGHANEGRNFFKF